MDARHLYWANNGAGTIVEANLDGTGAHVIASGQKSPEAVAVDASHLYWTNFGAGTIMEASLDGTGAKAIGLRPGPRGRGGGGPAVSSEPAATGSPS